MNGLNDLLLVAEEDIKWLGDAAKRFDELASQLNEPEKSKWGLLAAVYQERAKGHQELVEKLSDAKEPTKSLQCGTEATANSNSHAVADAEFDCPSCGHHFSQGDGGETGGLCTPCLEAELQKAYVEAAKSQRRRSELAKGKSSRKRLRPISVYRAA